MVLRWQVHLAREQPRKLAVVVAAVSASALLAYAWVGNVIFAAAMIVAVLGALSDFLFPVTYTLTLTQASASTPVGKRVIAWKDVRKCYLDDFGVKLSSLKRRSRLEAYRGVYLRFGDNREEVLEAVRRLWRKDV